MTHYQRLKALAKSKGIDTRKNLFGDGGYWLTKADGSDLYPDDNFCADLKQLEAEIRQA